MWIVVTGPLATGKQVVAEHLVNHHNFTLLPQSGPEDPGVETELIWMGERLRAHREAEKTTETRHVIIRSLWDMKEVFWPAYEGTYLKASTIKALENLIDWPQLKPPQMVIYLKGRKIESYSRMQLTGRTQVNEAIYDKIQSLYEQFLKKVAVPVIDIDATLTADKIIDQVDYCVASVEASKLTDQTIWKRSFYR